MILSTDKSKLVQLVLTTPFVFLSLISLNISPSALASNSSSAKEKNPIATTSCSVINIQTGQLALRSSPNGKAIAGLDNGNTVALLRYATSPWVYVRVIEGPNPKVNGLKGWVNSNYLYC